MVLSSKPGLYEMTMPDDDQHTLKLLKVKSADIGEMEFMASNKFGSDSGTFNVEMAGTQRTEPSIHFSVQSRWDYFTFSFLSTAPPTFETIMEDLDVCAGETPCFAVVVEGKPIPDILWFKVFNPFYQSKIM